MNLKEQAIQTIEKGKTPNFRFGKKTIINISIEWFVGFKYSFLYVCVCPDSKPMHQLFNS